MRVTSIGIFAHVDAGKTTLSEQMLLRAGAIRQAGSVDRGTAFTDSMEVEKRRGISVRAVCVSLQWKGTLIRLIDTPGHTDFSSEIERSFWAIDAAVIVIDAAQGVQPQTETLFAALSGQGLPVLFFLNKMDRPGADAESVLRQIRRRLTPLAVPLWCRASMARLIPASSARRTSSRLASSQRSLPSASVRAMASSARFFRSVPAVARTREASRAAAPCSSRAVMVPRSFIFWVR